MIVDVHIHPYCKEITVKPSPEEAVRRMFSGLPDRPDNEKMIRWFHHMFHERSVAEIIRDMDESQVDKACIVALDMTTQYNVELVTNDDLGRLASLHSDRFIPFASVDPNMGRAAVDKLAEAVEKHGCRGLKLAPPLQGFDFCDTRHYPLWETILDLDVIVWSHTAHQKPFPGTDARLGHPLRLEPMAVKYPELKIILGHCGFPWLWEAHSMVARHPNVYIDISAYPGMYDQFPWEAYFQANVGHKILFATDYPRVGFENALSALEKIKMPQEAKEGVLGGNAANLLGL